MKSTSYFLPDLVEVDGAWEEEISIGERGGGYVDPSSGVALTKTYKFVCRVHGDALQPLPSEARPPADLPVCAGGKE
jgi:hypothetical protein